MNVLFQWQVKTYETVETDSPTFPVSGGSAPTLTLKLV